MLSLVAIIVAGVAFVLATLAVVWARRAVVAAAAPHSRALADLLASVEKGDVQRLPMLLRQLDQHLTVAERRLGDAEARLTTAVQRIGLVRYDADENLGGKVSFVLALLDDNRDGVLLTSVYRLEDSRIFLREVNSGQVRHELADEEGRALKMALDDDLQRIRRERTVPAQPASGGRASGEPGPDQRGDAGGR